MNRAERRRQNKLTAKTLDPGPTGMRTDDAMRAMRHQDLSDKAMELYLRDERDAAKALWMQVLNEDENYPAALHGMGVIARDMDQYEVGAELMRRALLQEPTNAVMYSNLGTLFEQWEKYDDAIAAYKTGLRHSPRKSILYTNLGSCLAHMGQRSEALRAFRKAMELGGDDNTLLSNYASTLSDVGQFQRADPYFTKALERQTTPSYLNFVYGTQLNKQGRWKEGWPHYEHRFVQLMEKGKERKFPQSRWDGGGDIAKVLLWAEQGIGDEIRFASMIPDALETGVRVTIECEPRLVDLLQRSFPSAFVMAKPFVAGEVGMEHYDAQCPFGSLGLLFRSSAEDFRRSRHGYLIADPDRRRQFAVWLRDLGPGRKVGICWRSGLRKAFRNEYYTAVEELAPLMNQPDVTFINLQYDVRPEEITDFEERFERPLHDLNDLDLRTDLDGAAALTSELDLVVSAATSVSCMGGALGVPTLEFRPSPVAQGYLVDGHCPWFPSLRYVDKRAGEPWSIVFKKIDKQMKAMAANNSAAKLR